MILKRAKVRFWCGISRMSRMASCFAWGGCWRRDWGAGCCRRGRRCRWAFGVGECGRALLDGAMRNAFGGVRNILLNGQRVCVHSSHSFCPQLLWKRGRRLLLPRFCYHCQTGNHPFPVLVFCFAAPFISDTTIYYNFSPVPGYDEEPLLTINKNSQQKAIYLYPTTNPSAPASKALFLPSPYYTVQQMP